MLSTAIMKIDHDLRQAIKAAHDAQEHRDEHKLRHDAAVHFLKKRPAVAKKLTNLRKKKDVAFAQYKALANPFEALLESLGLETCQDSYKVAYGDFEKEKFVAAGGEFNTRPKWNYNKVMARLAAAEPEARDAILREYGINWT